MIVITKEILIVVFWYLCREVEVLFELLLVDEIIGLKVDRKFYKGVIKMVLCEFIRFYLVKFGIFKSKIIRYVFFGMLYEGIYSIFY